MKPGGFGRRRWLDSWGIIIPLLSLLFFRAYGTSTTIVPDQPPIITVMTPHNNTRFRTDYLFVAVDVSGLSRPLGLAEGEVVVCMVVDHSTHDCSYDYDLGSQSIGIVAKMLDLGAVPASPSHHTLTVFAATSQNGMIKEVLAQDEVVVSLVGTGQCTPRPVKRKVYDAFMFFDELDILELRLKELDPVVDYFILIESQITHSRLHKPFCFQDNKSRFAPYLDRIIHVRLPEEYLLYGTGPSHWDRETRQRDALVEALQQYHKESIQRGHPHHDHHQVVPMPAPEDLIIISDMDEIPRRERLEELCTCEEAVFPSLLLLDWYLYSMQWRAKIPWGMIAKEGSVVVTADFLLQHQPPPSPTACRRLLRPAHLPSFASLPMATFTSAGWHLSSFGGADWLRNKFISYADHVYNKAFLLEPGRLERLAHFGVPYFYLDAIPSLEDNLFLPAPTNPPPTSLPHTLRDRSDLSPDLVNLLWPPVSHDPEVGDERWLRQDFLLARHYLKDEKRMTLPGVKPRRPSTTFTYNCHTNYMDHIHDFCTRMGSDDCHQLLRGVVEKDCSSSSSPSFHGDSSLEIYLDDSQLVPVRLSDRTFVVEYQSGDNATTAARRLCDEFFDKEASCLQDLEGSIRQHLEEPPQPLPFPLSTTLSS